MPITFHAGVMDQLAPVLENAGLLERLADEAMPPSVHASAATSTTTQSSPISASTTASKALACKAGADNPLRTDILARQEVALEELHTLRELVSGMRNGVSGGDDAPSAPPCSDRRFTELSGIDVSVQCEGTLPIRRKLAAATFPMVSEALTNVRRHTAAPRAEILVCADDNDYIVEIRNPQSARHRLASRTLRTPLRCRTRGICK